MNLQDGVGIPRDFPKGGQELTVGKGNVNGRIGEGGKERSLPRMNEGREE
jgi:hypothetical protein